MLKNVKEKLKFYNIHNDPLIIKWNYNKKIKKIVEEKLLSTDEEQKIKRFFKQFNMDISNFHWHSFYKKFKGFEVSNIPESLFYAYILPTLNDEEMSKAYEDKSILVQHEDIIKTPKILLSNNFGYNYNENNIIIDLEEIKLDEGEYIIKPSLDSGGGKDVELLKVCAENIQLSNERMSLKEIINIYGMDFIIQEKISQKGNLFYKIHPSSLNTLRVMTLRKGNEIKILSVVARFGDSGSIKDNAASGGIAVGVNTVVHPWSLKKEGVSKDNRILKEHPHTKVKFEGNILVNSDEIEKKVIKLHRKLRYFDLVSWDIAIDKNNEIYLIEFNTGHQEINFHQMNNGPLFKEETNYILEKVQKKFKSIKL